MTMHTRCPACETVYRVTEAEVGVASGMVQCGICKHFFNAFSSQVDVTGDEAPGYSLKDILAEKSRDLAAKDLSSALKNSYVAPRPPAPWWSTLIWSILIIIALLAGLAQLAWHKRAELIERPELKPHIAQVCEKLPCDLQKKTDLSRIELLSRDVRSHPSYPNALLITATFINHADFEQPYPRVGLQLSNLSGDVIAQRFFTPQEYLKTPDQTPPLMAMNVPVTMIMEVVDPGDATISYRFEFL